LNHLPKRIKQLRKQKGLTQIQLAQRIGITQAFLAEIESGRKRPSLEVLEKLCDTLDCSADYLLDIAQPREYKTFEQSAMDSLTSRGITQQMLEEIAERNLTGEQLRLAIKLAQTMQDDKNSPS